MPTYGYRCKSCSYELEEFQKISDPLLVQCPSCHKDTLVRIIGGGAGLVFKGSGFYLTDYKKKSTSGETPKPSAPKTTDTSPKSPPAPPAGDRPASGGDATPRDKPGKS